MKKMDMGKVKNYLFFKGERIGLALAVVIAVLFLAYGVLSASKSNPPANAPTWQAALDKGAKDLEARINSAPAAPQAEAIKPGIAWPYKEDFAAVGPWFPYDIAEISKRRNPEVVAIENIKAEYVRAGVFTYDLQPNAKVPSVGILKPAGGGVNPRPGFPPAFTRPVGPVGPMGPGGAVGAGQGDENLVRLMRPRRMVVVNAAFPMHDQYERFREALRLPTMAELLNNKELAPRLLGFDVVRREILANNRRGEPEILYQYDLKKGKTVVVSKKIDNLLREAIVDQENVQKFQSHLYPTPLTPSLATPLPKLSLGEYPTIELPGIVAAPTGFDQPVGPMGEGNMKLKGPMENQPNMGGGVEGKYDLLPWSQLPLFFREKFKGNYNPVDPLGMFAEADDKKGMFRPGENMGPGMPPMGVGLPPMGVGLPPMGVGEGQNISKIPDALIRFLDVDVEMGKSYEYSLQVWLANPNYGKKNDVTHAALAEIKELRSPRWVFAKLSAPVPPEHFYYLADQQNLVTKVQRGGSDLRPIEKEPNKAPFQIHTWVTTVKDRLAGNKERLISDWVIAERLLLRRGEFIGRNEFMVEAPEWEPLQNRFVLGSSAPVIKVDKKKGAGNLVQIPGVPVNFIVGSLPRVPLVVDFEGGKLTRFYVGRTLVNDESAFEVLILDANGKLIVRNSREDTEVVERQKRHEAWGQRVQELRQLSQPGGIIQLPGAPGSN